MMRRRYTQARMDEMLSAYLDGELSQEEVAWLEARLEEDPNLRERLDALRSTVALIRGLPRVQIPRNFLLTPAMVARARPRPARRWLAPALSFATAASALLCVAVLVGSLLAAPSHVALAPFAAPEEVAMEQPIEETPRLAEEVPTAGEETDRAADEGTMETATPVALGLGGPTPTPKAPPPAAPEAESTWGITRTAPPPTMAVETEEAEVEPPQPTPLPEAGTEQRSPAGSAVALLAGLSLLTLSLGVAAVFAWRARRR